MLGSLRALRARAAGASRRTMAASPAAAALPADGLFLGLDSSTQGLKVTAIDKDFKVTYASAINYQKDLPAYNLKNGVHAKPGHVVTQPTLMVRRGRGALLRPACRFAARQPRGAR